MASLTRRPSFTPQEDFYYSFLFEAELRAVVRLEGLDQMESPLTL
jgi:hypothetical protein